MYIVVVLQHDRAHAVRLGLLRGVERVECPRAAVGLGMQVDVDRTGQRAARDRLEARLLDKGATAGDDRN